MKHISLILLLISAVILAFINIFFDEIFISKNPSKNSNSNTLDYYCFDDKKVYLDDYNQILSHKIIKCSDRFIVLNYSNDGKIIVSESHIKMEHNSYKRLDSLVNNILKDKHE